MNLISLFPHKATFQVSTCINEDLVMYTQFPTSRPQPTQMNFSVLMYFIDNPPSKKKKKVMPLEEGVILLFRP